MRCTLSHRGGGRAGPIAKRDRVGGMVSSCVGSSWDCFPPSPPLSVLHPSQRPLSHVTYVPMHTTRTTGRPTTSAAKSSKPRRPVSTIRDRAS